MVRVTIHTLGEHVINNMEITGPKRDILAAVLEMFLATYTGPANVDLDYAFAEYLVGISMGQGRILEWVPPPPMNIH
jgi:hypothetical protein